jgi:hypothetical protein
MSVGLGLAVAAPVLLLPVAYLVWWVDRFRLLPLSRFIAVFAMSSAAGLLLAARWPSAAGSGWRAVGPAMPLSSLAAERLPGDVADAARLVVLLLAVLVFLLARWRVETLLDGVIFGVAAGVGCALPAGWLLAESAPVVEGGELVVTALLPIVAGVVIGLTVAWARLLRRWRWRIPAVAVGAGAGVTVLVGARLAAAAAGRIWVGMIVLVVAFAVAATVAVIVEVRVSRRELAEEATLGVLPEWVIEVVPWYWRRIRASWWPRRDERRALARLLVQLAFRKHQLRHLEGERATLYSLEVGRLRERARRLLDPTRAPVAGKELTE